MAKLGSTDILGSLVVNRNLTVAGVITANLIGDVTGDLTGNADTATILATARNIGGVSFNGSTNINLPGVNTTGNQNTTGSAAKLTTTRNISLSGDASGSINFDGSADVVIPVVVADNSHAHTGEQITTGTISDARLPDTISSNITGTSTGVSTTVAASSTANLLYATIAANDYFRLLVGGTSDAGYAEIATADGGNEPIYVRQYSGVFSTLTRTATILDASGNTNFPGTVTAPTFVGALTGTASGNLTSSSAITDSQLPDSIGATTFTGDITLATAVKILDADNSGYYINPSSASSIATLTVSNTVTASSLISDSVKSAEIIMRDSSDVEKATMQYNSTTESIDFIFN